MQAQAVREGRVTAPGKERKVSERTSEFLTATLLKDQRIQNLTPEATKGCLRVQRIKSMF